MSGVQGDVHSYRSETVILQESKMLEDKEIVERTVQVPVQVLQDYGCRNCVWKAHMQCPRGYVKAEAQAKDGYCTEFGNFLLELRRTSGSLSQMKEKFFLYGQELQAMSDKMKYLKLEDELEELRSQTMPSESTRDKIAELKMAVESYKLWWARLTEGIVKGLSRIGDREERAKEAAEGPTRSITIQQFNMMLRQAEAYLISSAEEKEAEEK